MGVEKKLYNKAMKDLGEEKKSLEILGEIASWIAAIVIVIVLFYTVGGRTYKEYVVNHELYEQAEQSIYEDFSNTRNLKLAKYSKKRITDEGYELHDFGKGDLCYSTYIVTIPIEYDVAIGHMELAPNITVYYYDPDGEMSNENTNISEHYVTIGVFDEIRNAFEQ